MHTEAQIHAELVDKVKAIPLVAKKLLANAMLRVCPNCYSLYEDFQTPESVDYCLKCQPRLNNFARMNGMYVSSVPIEHAPDEALKLILKQLGPK